MHFYSEPKLVKWGPLLESHELTVKGSLTVSLPSSPPSQPSNLLSLTVLEPKDSSPVLMVECSPLVQSMQLSAHFSKALKPA